jgi:hypothetical protein
MYFYIKLLQYRNKDISLYCHKIIVKVVNKLVI